MLIIQLLSLLYFVTFPIFSSTSDKFQPHILEIGTVYHHGPSDSHYKIYCYPGSPRIVINTWTTVSVKIDSEPGEYKCYEGATVEEVLNQLQPSYSTQKECSNYNDLINLRPFSVSCFAIVSNKKCTLTLQINRVDPLKFNLVFASIVIFFLGKFLAESPLFYYVIGTLSGILFSIVFIFYMTLKLMPVKKPALAIALAGGTTFFILIWEWMYLSLTLIASRYQSHLLGYIFISGLVSLAVCYRFGPVTDQRGQNLIKWSIQGICLLVIYYCSQLEEISLLIVLTIVAVHKLL